MVPKIKVDTKNNFSDSGQDVVNIIAKTIYVTPIKKNISNRLANDFFNLAKKRCIPINEMKNRKKLIFNQKVLKKAVRFKIGLSSHSMV
jgi:hypothetical protein